MPTPIEWWALERLAKEFSIRSSVFEQPPPPSERLFPWLSQQGVKEWQAAFHRWKRQKDYQSFLAFLKEENQKTFQILCRKQPKFRKTFQKLEKYCRLALEKGQFVHFFDLVVKRKLISLLKLLEVLQGTFHPVFACPKGCCRVFFTYSLPWHIFHCVFCQSSLLLLEEGDLQETRTMGLEGETLLQREEEKTEKKYFGRYELLEVLGEGGMGTVYKAWDRQMKRYVALKVLRFPSRESVKRFLRESQIAAKLMHPHIVPVYDFGEIEGTPYLVQGLIEGVTLEEYVREKGVLEEKEALRILIPLCQAVEYAHSQGVLHRDIKPSNIMIRGKIPFLMDFGLAKEISSEDSGFTRTGMIVGTPSYMAPEQALGEKNISTAVDVYALGGVLFFLLSGRPPFEGEDLRQVLYAVCEKEAPFLRELRPGISRDVEGIVRKCLEKNPKRRYESVSQLRRDLEAALLGETVLARPVGKGELLWRLLKRHRRVTFFLFFVLILFFAWVSSQVYLKYLLKEELEKEKEKRRREALLRERKRRERVKSLLRQVPAGIHRGELENFCQKVLKEPWREVAEELLKCLKLSVSLPKRLVAIHALAHWPKREAKLLKGKIEKAVYKHFLSLRQIPPWEVDLREVRELLKAMHCYRVLSSLEKLYPVVSLIHYWNTHLFPWQSVQAEFDAIVSDLFSTWYKEATQRASWKAYQSLVMACVLSRAVHDYVEFRDISFCLHKAEKKACSKREVSLSRLYLVYAYVCLYQRSRKEEYLKKALRCAKELISKESFPSSFKALVYGALGGVYLEITGDLSQARKSFKKALQCEPSNPAWEFLLSFVEEKRGKIDQAISRLKKLAHQFPKSFLVLKRLGILWVISGKVKKAEKTFKKALEIYPDSLVCHINLAEIYIGQKEWKKAKEHLEFARRFYPTHHLPFYFLAKWAQAQGKLPLALEFLEKAFERAALGWKKKILLHMAEISMRMRKWKKASEYFEEALILGSSRMEKIRIWRRLGEVLFHEKNFAEAEKYFLKAFHFLSMEKGKVREKLELYLWLAKIGAAKRDWNKVFFHLDMLFERVSQLRNVSVSRSVLQKGILLLEEMEEEVESLEDRLRALALLGKYSLVLSQAKRAKEYASKGLSLLGAKPVSLERGRPPVEWVVIKFLRSQANFLLGKEREGWRDIREVLDCLILVERRFLGKWRDWARKLLQKALLSVEKWDIERKLRGKEKLAYYSLIGQAYLACRQSLKAWKYLEKALERASSRKEKAWVYYSRAAALYFQGKFYEAEKELRRAIDILPSEPEFYYALGKVYVQLSDFKRAAQYLRRSLKLGLKGRKRKEVEKLLKQLLRKR